MIKSVKYDIQNQDGKFHLVDSKLGDISQTRFPYICDHVKLNRARLNHMLDNLADWSWEERDACRTEMNKGTEFDTGAQASYPKRYDSL